MNVRPFEGPQANVNCKRRDDSRPGGHQFQLNNEPCCGTSAWGRLFLVLLEESVCPKRVGMLVSRAAATSNSPWVMLSVGTSSNVAESPSVGSQTGTSSSKCGSGCQEA